MIAIVAITLGASCLLISATQGTKPGHQPWRPGSILRPLTELLTFDYQYPTFRGVEIKWLAQGLGAAAALLAGAAAWFSRTRRDEEDPLAIGEPSLVDQPRGARRRLSDVTPATAAQIALVLFALWVMLSALWSPWPQAALGEGVRQLIVTLWAVALGRTLGRRGVRGASLAMASVLTVTAALGIWYYLERNPVLRLEFPIGNPIFLAACLLPGITLAMAALTGVAVGLIGRAGSVASAAGGSRSKVVELKRRWWLIAGAVLALPVLAWAFRLTDSRGPAIGLVVGVVVAVYVAAPRRIGWMLLATPALAAAVAWWFRLWPVSYVLSRPDTIRLRLCAWKYAVGLFLEQPIFGRGQGAYLLLAQQMSRADALIDPLAFPGPLLGRAHSEWLEILTELGAIGFALCATALGMTFWSATVALRRMANPTDRWCLIGLLAAFVAIIVEEQVNVALRMPGLPVIFYTVIGLVWAGSGERSAVARDSAARLGRGVRVIVLAGAIAGSGIIAQVVWRDWQGALADPAITAHANKQDWEGAFRKADIAMGYRLVLEDRLSAAFQKTRVARDAAEYQVQQIQRMIGRLDEREGIPDNVIRLARQDSARFYRYAGMCLETGETQLKRIPAYPRIAGMMAEVWLLRGQMEVLEQRLGLRNQVRSYVPVARERMRVEYARDPLDADNALRLLSLSGDQPLMRRLNLLRVPLRNLGRHMEVHGRLTAALAVLMREPGFDSVMNHLLKKAGATLADPDRSPWPDPYAPETLRLAALAQSLRGEFAPAAAMAGDAAILAEKLRSRFPTTPSYCRLDQARYLLLGYPEAPGRAVEVCRKAIVGWPAARDREEQLKPLRRDLTLYLLAAGDNEAVIQTFRQINPELTAESLQRNVGYGLAELCRVYLVLTPDGRPARFGDWLERSLQLVPQWPRTRQIAVQAAFEAGDDATAIEHLEALEQLTADPQQMVAYVRGLLSQFPENQSLRAFIASRTGREPPF